MNRPFSDFVPANRFQQALAISPDGERVVFVSNASGQANLWCRQLGESTARQLTHFTDNSVRDVAFSPDGRQLAFLADRQGDEFHQVFVMDAAGGEPRQLTDEPRVQHHLAVDNPFSPDGRLLAYAGNDRDPTCQDVLVCDLATGESRRVLAAEGLYTPVAFSPDSAALCVVSEKSNTDNDAYLVDLVNGGEPQLLTPHDGEVKCLPGPWLPDGSGVVVVSDAGRDFTGLGVLPRAGGELRWLDTPEWDVEQVAASADGNRLAWSVNEDGYSKLRLRDLRTGEAVTLPALAPGVISALRVSGEGERLTFLLATATRPTEVAVVDVAQATSELVTDSAPPALADVRAVEPELVRFAALDGRQIAAFLYRPHGMRPGERYPLVLSIHGGPEAQERTTYNYAGFYQYLLANGVGVLAPNVRGSTGYGSTYQRLIHHAWGGDDLRDFESAVRYLHDLAWVDPTRVAVFGASYGGFATLSCVSRLPGYWAAAVDIVGPANLVTLARSVPPTWRRMMAAWVGDPDTEADFLLARSPVTYADDIVAPLFVIQGANDPRVAKAESDQIVDRLCARGVDVRYDVYDDEGHGFTKRTNEVRALGDAADFLLGHLT